ncbi:macro domain-containing protein [Natronococcus wangiae]|uniref:macro domain-containing protein n=1 Tax=Natronococcus wangiae TaxID=3068275 RepID=UPI002740229A|nr:macro domain-containing protein [Natronococcus sp. AD5]
MEFTIIRGDIANQTADALVNAAGTSLRMGSGVAGSLRRNANGPINQEAMENGPVDLGGVAVTDAYDLDADHVIHAAAMPHYGDGRATTESIRSATQKSLQKADELGCESIVIPIPGTGAAGFDFRKGAELVCQAVWNYEPSSVTDSRVIAYSQREYEALETIASDVRSR